MLECVGRLSKDLDRLQRRLGPENYRKLVELTNTAGPEDVEIVDYHRKVKLMTDNGMRPIHPGEILRENRGITADTAMRLARYFNTSERFWLNLQMEYKLREAQIQRGSRIVEEVAPYNA